MLRFSRFFALTGTALVAVAATAARAEIAELPQLRIQSGGFDLRLTAGATVQAALVEDDDAATPETGDELDIFARFNGEWTSSDGIVAGANVEWTNQARETEALNTGEIYGFVASDYGRLEVGEQDGPADQLAFNAPVVALGQIRGDFSRYAGSQALLRAQDTRDAFKVIYLSPPISGLRGGVSWSPRVRQNFDAADPTARIILNDAFEFGLQYQRPVGDWILGLSGSYAVGNADSITTRQDLNSWSVGTEARRGPLRIGAAYVNRGSSNRLESDFDQWEINGGIGWIEDRWGISASAARTEARTRTNQLIGLGGFYALSPNLQLRSDVVSFRETGSGQPIEDGVVAMMEIAISI